MEGVGAQHFELPNGTPQSVSCLFSFSIPLFVDRLDAIVEIDSEIGVAEDPPGRTGLRAGEVLPD